MQDDHGNARRVSALFNVDRMPITNVQSPLIKRINRRVEIG